jgi:hypothetical protein
MRRVVPLLVVALCAAPAASAAGSPPAFNAAVHAAAKAQRSVHYVSHSKGPELEVTIVADAGRDEGIQHITVRSAKKSGRATVIVSAGVAYLRGDAFTLSRFLGFTTSSATDYARVWIRIVPTSPSFGAIAEAVTLASAIDDLGPRGTLAFARTAPGLRAVRGTLVQSGTQIVDTLYARGAGTPLPVKEVVIRPGVVATNVLSGWNRQVHVAVPAKTIPISKVMNAGGPSA